MALIVERADSSRLLQHIQNPKFLMPRIFTVAEAQAIVRSKLSLGQEVGLLLYAHEKYLL